jgi:hypothetical protein
MNLCAGNPFVHVSLLTCNFLTCFKFGEVRSLLEVLIVMWREMA